MNYSEMEWSVNLGNVTSQPIRILTADHTESAETFSQLSIIFPEIRPRCLFPFVILFVCCSLPSTLDVEDAEISARSAGNICDWLLLSALEYRGTSPFRSLSVQDP